MNDELSPHVPRTAPLADELRDSEELFRLVVEASPTAMLIVDGQGTIAMVNAQAEVLFGYTRPELLGYSIDMLVPDRFRPQHIGNRLGYSAHPQPRAMGANTELRGRRKDGSEMAVEISLSPIRAANGLSVLASVVDVTARKEAESEWRRSQEEIAHLSRVAVLGELSGALAHELNQPLAGILSNAQAAQRFLARDPVDLTEVRAILADIVADDKRAGDIIHRMRQLLKKGEVPRQPLGLNDIVHEVLALVRGDLATHGITARTDLAPDLPVVHADHVQLRQVLLNLVINACDAMSALAPGDRQLLVRTSPADPADGQSVQVSVSDGGVGIPADDLDRIFDSYFTTKAHGLGLGLSLCRTIITAHGGRVWATNNVDRGATLCFTLPAVTTSR